LPKRMKAIFSPFAPAHPRLRGDRRGGPDITVVETGSPLSWGRTENAAPSVVTHSIVKQRVGLGSCEMAKEYRPLFMRWARGVPFVLPFCSPKKSRGMARRQGAWPGLLQTGPRVSRLPGEPGYAGPWGETSPPRLAARHRASSGLRPTNGRATPGAICPWRVVPEVARG